MPTIDELTPVIVASDDDLLPVSQGGTARRVTRGQLLAGTQSAIALVPGLLGRVSAGLGPPEQITLGSGLSIADGILAAAPRYSPAALPTASQAGWSDLVPISQGGTDRTVTVRTLLSTNGIEISGQTAQADLGVSRALADWLSDALAVEAFGAVGDGVTNDSKAVLLAVAAGRPVLFGPKTYRVDGQLDISGAATLIGTLGLTTLRRQNQSGGAWIKASGPSFASVGIIFDGGTAADDSWGVLLDPNCTRSVIRDCSFINMAGPNLGTGLTIQARDGLSGHGSEHSIESCLFQGNTCHGLWLQAAAGALVSRCRAVQNGGFGICLDFNDPTFQQSVRQSLVTGCSCSDNSRGISVGNYNATNSEPPRWGLDNPDAIDIVVSGNSCVRNSAYGIAVSGTRIQVVNNHIVVDGVSNLASGILCNASLSSVIQNFVVGPATFGIDAGGSADLCISSNIVSSCNVGINAGGSTRVRVNHNTLSSNRRAITIFQIETDGNGSNFGISCSDIWIEDNSIELDAGDGGIFLLDGPERVSIARNRFVSSVDGTLPDLCWAHTESVSLIGNSWNGMVSTTLGAQVNGQVSTLVVPEILDRVSVAASTVQIDAIQGLHQVAMAGKISFIRVTDGGSGYTRAQVVITGAGVGALASAYIRDSVVIGIAVSAGGSGYASLTTEAVIVGDGRNAALRPYVGLPGIRDRQLTLQCLGQIRFSRGSLDNWTAADITVPAESEVVWRGTEDGWRACAFASVDYLQPVANGGLSVRSKSGDISLLPAQGGRVHIGSEAEPVGFVTCCGRGSPDGTVVAPPGSDYRDLEGAAGAIFWIKRSGSDASGWFAVA